MKGMFFSTLFLTIFILVCVKGDCDPFPLCANPPHAQNFDMNIAASGVWHEIAASSEVLELIEYGCRGCTHFQFELSQLNPLNFRILRSCNGTSNKIGNGFYTTENPSDLSISFGGSPSTCKKIKNLNFCLLKRKEKNIHFFFFRKSSFFNHWKEMTFFFFFKNFLSFI